MDTNSLKGTYDRYPDEWESWKQLIDDIEQTLTTYGFNPVSPPSIEPTSLFQLKSGEDIVDEMFTLPLKNKDAALLPEQTPSRARMVQNRKDLTKPIKWYDTSKRWRYEAVQKGRDREFWQTDVDIFGADLTQGSAEIIACATDILRTIGLENDTIIRINDRRLLRQALNEIGVETSNMGAVLRVIDKWRDVTEDEFITLLQDENISHENATDIVTLVRDGYTDNVLDTIDDNVVSDFNTLKNLLEAYNVRDMCTVDASIVRGTNYYTGTVFEAFDTNGDYRALFGGGEYNSLVSLFGDVNMNAVGFAIGYSPIVALLKERGEWPYADTTGGVVIAGVSDDVTDEVITIAQEIRDTGVEVNTVLKNTSLSGKLQYADTINAEKTIIVGSRDLQNGEVTIKNMNTGDEQTIEREQVVEYIEYAS